MTSLTVEQSGHKHKWLIHQRQVFSQGIFRRMTNSKRTFSGVTRMNRTYDVCRLSMGALDGLPEPYPRIFSTTSIRTRKKNDKYNNVSHIRCRCAYEP
ncbi:hypothetical protein [Vibrio zhanjiangensis]|uniref:hypothetical protein n=1 Tax=Vibrio zhanjiangensis TaxID=1046128 RepID=UPI0024E0A101|nr:hypothetical protein [Vibrio zhanjiangensis]